MRYPAGVHKKQDGRVIERTACQEVIDENRERVLSNPACCKLRQPIVKPQVETLKRQFGFTFTLL